ncbi:MAG TPA: hypothetical protein VGI82_01955 [Chitinophagaceae bacterium]
MVTIETMDTKRAGKRINRRWWVLSSVKKRYSLAAKAKIHNKNIKMYFIFINITCP